MTEAAIKSELERTQRFAERQKLLKKLWKIESEAASERRDQQLTAQNVPRATKA